MKILIILTLALASTGMTIIYISPVESAPNRIFHHNRLSLNVFQTIIQPSPVVFVFRCFSSQYISCLYIVHFFFNPKENTIRRCGAAGEMTNRFEKKKKRQSRRFAQTLLIGLIPENVSSASCKIFRSRNTKC